MAIEDRSLAWRWLQSWYVLLTLPLGLLSWLAFFYTGLRARRPVWLAWGVVYLAGMIWIVSRPLEKGPNGRDATSLEATAVLVVLWIFSVVHAVSTRETFLRALDARQRPPAPVPAAHPSPAGAVPPPLPPSEAAPAPPPVPPAAADAGNPPGPPPPPPRGPGRQLDY